MKAHADVVDAFFELCGAFMDICPHVLLLHQVGLRLLPSPVPGSVSLAA